MLARVTDVFTADATRYSEEQVRFFDDLMVRLIESVGSGARATLAVKLAPIGNAPSGAIHALAFDPAWRFPASPAFPGVTQAAGASDRLLFEYDATLGAWCFLGAQQGR